MRLISQFLMWSVVMYSVTGSTWEQESQLARDRAEHQEEQQWEADHDRQFTQPMLNQHDPADDGLKQNTLSDQERAHLLENTQRRRQTHRKVYDLQLEQVSGEDEPSRPAVKNMPMRRRPMPMRSRPMPMRPIHQTPSGSDESGGADHESASGSGFDWRQRIRDNLDTNTDFSWSAAVDKSEMQQPQQPPRLNEERSTLHDMKHLLSNSILASKNPKQHEDKRNQRRLVQFN